VASGVNNAVARIAGLLAIAAVGAVVSASFAARLTHNADTLPPHSRLALSAQKTKPFVTTAPRAQPGVHQALEDASVQALHAGLLVAAGLAFLGGAAALAGIENPRARR
jgi:hypothetical protein